MVSLEASLPGLQMAAFLLCPHMAFSLCVPIPGLSSFYEDTRETPGGPVVRTLHFHFKGHGFSPGRGTKIQQGWEGGGEILVILD